MQDDVGSWGRFSQRDLAAEAFVGGGLKFFEGLTLGISGWDERFLAFQDPYAAGCTVRSSTAGGQRAAFEFIKNIKQSLARLGGDSQVV